LIYIMLAISDGERIRTYLAQQVPVTHPNNREVEPTTMPRRSRQKHQKMCVVKQKASS